MFVIFTYMTMFTPIFTSGRVWERKKIDRKKEYREGFSKEKKRERKKKERIKWSKENTYGFAIGFKRIVGRKGVRMNY